MDAETLVANPTSIRERIDKALESLANLSSARRSRADIIADLAKDLSEYYGYIEELAAFLLDLFSPSECVEYMDASDRPRPLVIRTNTLKTTRKELMEMLGKRGAALEAIDWSKVAIKVTESSVPIGATPEYLAGYYMLQSAASLNPVMALAPQPGEKVLDMSAAPGGKTSYIAQLMKNSGTVIANDLKPQRQKATVANLHRLGVKNTIVCCYDGRKINQTFKGFDRVLLDAPCSGLGVISRDQSVKLQRTVKDIQRISHLQKELLRAAVDAVDPKSPTGGVIVYSTCSISCEENEQVVDYILKKRYVRLIETGLEVGKPGFTRHMEKRFHPSLSLTRRFYPHVHNMDGFYVAKFQKYQNGVRGEEDEEEDSEEEGDGDDSEDGSNGHSLEDLDSQDELHGQDSGSADSEDEDEESEDEAPAPKKAKNGDKKTAEAPAPAAAKKAAAPVVPAKVAAPAKVETPATAAKKTLEASIPVAVTSNTPAKVAIKNPSKVAEVAPVPPQAKKSPVVESKKTVEAPKVVAAAPAEKKVKVEPAKAIPVAAKKAEPVVSSSEDEEDDDNSDFEDVEIMPQPRRGKKRSILALRQAMARAKGKK